MQPVHFYNHRYATFLKQTHFASMQLQKHECCCYYFFFPFIFWKALEPWRNSCSLKRSHAMCNPYNCSEFTPWFAVFFFSFFCKRSGTWFVAVWYSIRIPLPYGTHNIVKGDKRMSLESQHGESTKLGRMLDLIAELVCAMPSS